MYWSPLFERFDELLFLARVHADAGFGVGEVASRHLAVELPERGNALFANSPV